MRAKVGVTHGCGKHRHETFIGEVAELFYLTMGETGFERLKYRARLFSFKANNRSRTSIFSESSLTLPQKISKVFPDFDAFVLNSVGL